MASSRRSSNADHQIARALRRELARAGYIKKPTSVHRAWDPAVASLDLRRAAKVAGVVHSATLWTWLKGQNLPGRGPSDPGRFWDFIHKLALDPTAFVGRVPATRHEKGRIRRICADCGDIRWEQPWRLRVRKIDVDWERREARGRCKRCSGRHMMRTSSALREAPPDVSPKEWRITVAEAKKPEERWAKRNLGDYIRRGRPVPRLSTEHQRAAARVPRLKSSIQALLKGSRRRPISLCALCGLMVEQPVERHSWISGVWHAPCLRAWIDFSGQRRVQFARHRPNLTLPAAPPKMGRPFATKHLSRNLTAFLRRRADVLGYPGGCSIRESAADAKVDFRTLHRQLENVVRLLPGDWKLVYRLLTTGGNRSLQRLFQLPERLRDLNETGQRDGLVRWLCHHQMPIEQVSRITGMPLPQILALLKGRTRAGKSGELRRG